MLVTVLLAHYPNKVLWHLGRTGGRCARCSVPWTRQFGMDSL